MIPIQFVNLCIRVLVLPLVTATYSDASGFRNNQANPLWGAAESNYIRIVPAAYSDDNGLPAGFHRKSTRDISNIVSDDRRGILTRQNSDAISDFLPFWGQFVAHDIVSSSKNSSEVFHIPIPTCDKQLDALCEGGKWIPFTRQRAFQSPVKGDPRPLVNSLSAFLDASNVYGSSKERTDMLRTFNKGTMSTSPGALPPIVEDPSLMDNGEFGFFLTGDKRGNENPALQTFHTLFIREHNRKAGLIALEHSDWTDEIIFQEARKWVIAVYQKITVYEYVTMLLGSPLPAYQGYNASVNSAIDTFFMAAAFRYGHSAISSLILRLDDAGNQIANGHIVLRHGIFNPDYLKKDGIDPIIRGLMQQKDQLVDSVIVDDLRNHMRIAGHDLMAFNIQRGRDVGLPSYNQCRESLNLPRVTDFTKFSVTENSAQLLSLAYSDINDVDPYVGGLSEPHNGSALVGELFAASIRDQFLRLRDGDRFWFEKNGMFSLEKLNEIKSFSLAKLISLNSGVKVAVNPMVYQPKSSGVASTASPELLGAQLTTGLKLNWKVSGDEIEFTFESSNTEGWSAFGLGSNTMDGADIYLMTVVDQKVVVKDMFSESQMPVEDTSVDISDVSGSISDSLITATWKRKLSTKDTNDAEIVAEQKISTIWAKGSTFKVEYHGPSSRGTGPSINFLSLTAQLTDVIANEKFRLYRIFHGVMMFLCYAVIQPAGIYFIKFNNWITVHEYLMLAMASDVLKDILIAAISVTTHFDGIHKTSGAFIGLYLIFMMGLGFAIKYMSAKNPYYNKIRALHRYNGYIYSLFGFINGFFGVRILFNDNVLIQVLYIVLPVAFWAALFSWGFYSRKRKAESTVVVVSDKRRYNVYGGTVAQFDWQEIISRIETRNNFWTVIVGKVVDLQNFVDHPGGMRPLYHILGTDASDIFHGKKKLGFYPSIVHSRLAMWQLETHMIGLLSQEEKDELTKVASERKGSVDHSTASEYTPVRPDRYSHAMLTSKKEIGQGTKTLLLTFLIDKEQRVELLPGNVFHFMAVLQIDGKPKIVVKKFTPINLDQQGSLTFIIRAHPDAAMANYLCSLSQPSLVNIRGPIQADVSLLNPLVEDGTWTQVFIVANGIGVVASLPLIKYYMQTCKKNQGERINKMLFFYYETKSADVILKEELETFETKSDGMLTVKFGCQDAAENWNHYTGRITSQLLSDLLPPVPDLNMSMMSSSVVDGFFLGVRAQSRNGSQLLQKTSSNQRKSVMFKDIQSQGILEEDCEACGKSLVADENDKELVDHFFSSSRPQMLWDKVDINSQRIIIVGDNDFITSTAYRMRALGHPLATIIEFIC